MRFNYFPNHYAVGGWWHLLTAADGEKIELSRKREALAWLKARGASKEQLAEVAGAMKRRDEIDV
jgi:hypothetical protein